MIRTTLSVVAVAVMLAGCQGASRVATVAVSEPLPPMERPTYEVGVEHKYVDQDGAAVTQVVVSTAGDSYRGETSTGCTFRSHVERFAPAHEWQDCKPHADGTHSNLEIDGTLWPLQVGNKATYTASGSNTKGDSWRANRRCEVVEQVRVAVPAGEFDTYHVRCIDDSRTRDWYMSPATGEFVLFMNKHRRRGTVRKLELTSV